MRGRRPRSTRTDSLCPYTPLCRSRVAVAGGARELGIRGRCEVELLTFDGGICARSGPMPLWTFLRPTALTRAGRQVRMLAAGLGRDDFASEIERAHALSALILDRLPWRTGVTDADRKSTRLNSSH